MIPISNHWKTKTKMMSDYNNLKEMFSRTGVTFQEEKSLESPSGPIKNKSITAFFGKDGAIHSLFICNSNGELIKFISYPGEDY